MHPNPLFRSDDRALMRKLVDDIGFGMVFMTTPNGPRAAHTPLLWSGENRLRFHLSRGNALTAHIEGAQALVTVNGPDGYISPRWYDDRNTVPTWDYVALELEGTVSRLDEPALDAFLYDLVERHETRIGGEAWRASEASEDMWNRQLKGVRGFELAIRDWRPTLKLSQKRSLAERGRIADGLENTGRPALARMMREAAP